ncbi:MAG: phosphonate C-P lyase system protein PhnL, partial [Cyanobacteria bacterium P01_D01_bin.116]
VNLARGMVLCPRLLLLDEPTASLDADTSKLVVELIQSIKQMGTGILAVFHDPELIAELADNVVTVKSS